ncbi:MAG: tetratricopeptide repeat protein [Acidobacteriota bacterium]|nr:tetratricopeptide repeat protein [Acidobacteriota bacterium]
MKTVSANVRFPRRLLAFWLVSSFTLAFSFVVASAAPQAGGSDLLTETEQAMFTRGQALHNQGLYNEAVMILNQFLELYPNSTIKDLGLLWLGRSYLAQGDIVDAESIGVRLKAIPDTAMVGIYEEELRIARQNYARLAGPSHAQTDLAHRTPQSPSSLGSLLTPQPDQAKVTTKEVEVAVSRPIIQERRPAASEAAPTGPVNKIKDSAPPKTVTVKEPVTSGLFLPPALQLPANSPGVVSASTNTPPLTAGVASPKPPPKDAGAAKTSAKVDVPLLRVRIEEGPRHSSTEGTISYLLLITNEGSGAARDLTLRSELDAALDFAASNPSPNREELIAQKQVLTFRLLMVQPGETKVIEISVHAHDAGTSNLANHTKQSVFYRDSKGNLLHSH